MAGPYTKLNIDATGPVLYPDSIMDAGTLSLIDFIDPYVWPNEVIATPVVVGAEYKQFDARAVDTNFEGEPVEFDYALAVSGGTIVYAGTKGRNLLLPDCWKLDTGMKHFAMGFWLQMAPTIPNGSNNMIAGFISDGGVTQWNIVPVGNVGNVVTNLNPYFRRGASAWDMSTITDLDLANEVFNSAVHLLVLEYDEDAAGAYFRQRFYLDGQLIATSGAFATSGGNAFVAQATAGKAKIGCPAGYTGGTFTGNFRRAWFQDLTLSDRSLIELIKLDWTENKTRMGAA